MGQPATAIATALRVLAGASLLLPLVWPFSSFVFPFIVPKVVLFRAVAAAMLFSFLLLRLLQPGRFRVRRTPVTVALGLLLLSAALSAASGVDPSRSLWDTQERMLGLYTLLGYGAWYLVVTSTFSGWREWRRLFVVALVAGWVVVLLGAWQAIDPEFLSDGGVDRVGSTLGHGSYFGALGAFMAASAWLLLVRSETWEQAVFAAASGAAGIAGVLLSETRGTTLALAAAIGALLVGYVVVAEAGSWTRRVCAVALVGGVVVAGSAFAFRNAPMMQHIPVLRRFYGIDVARHSAAGARLAAWDIAFDAVRERPVLGWGPCNYYYAFNRHFRPELLKYGIEETWFDDAHCIPLNTMAVQGFVGLAAYLALYGTVFVVIWGARARGGLDGPSACAATAFLVAHVVHGLFIFEEPVSWLHLVLFLAFVNGATAEEEAPAASPAPEPAAPGGMRWAGGLATCAALGACVWLVDVRTARANLAARDAIRHAQYGEAKAAVRRMGEALSLGAPQNPDLRAIFANTAGVILPALLEAGREEDAEVLGRFAFEELASNALDRPLDPGTVIGRVKLARWTPGLRDDQGIAAELEAELLAAIELSPRRQELRFLLAYEKLHRGDLDGAEEVLQEIVANDPRGPAGWARLVKLYHETGRAEEAREAVQSAEDLGVVFTGKEAELVNEALGR